MFQSPMNVESASAVFRLGRRDADGTARWPIIKARAEPCFRLPISCFCAPAGLALYGSGCPNAALHRSWTLPPSGKGYIIGGQNPSRANLALVGTVFGPKTGNPASLPVSFVRQGQHFR